MLAPCPRAEARFSRTGGVSVITERLGEPSLLSHACAPKALVPSAWPVSRPRRQDRSGGRLDFRAFLHWRVHFGQTPFPTHDHLLLPWALFLSKVPVTLAVACLSRTLPSGWRASAAPCRSASTAASLGGLLRAHPFVGFPSLFPVSAEALTVLSWVPSTSVRASRL